MADEETIATDVMATPEQVLAAGGVSKRRRGASSSKRRSPSGQRRRAPTPEPPKDLPIDPGEEIEPQTEVSPTKTTAVKRISTTEKTLVTKRSLSSPGEGRQPLTSTVITGQLKLDLSPKSVEQRELIEQKTDLSPNKIVVVKRKSTTEKTLVTKRSQSSPGEGRQRLSLSSTEEDLKQEVMTAPRRRRSGGAEKTEEESTVKKSPSGVIEEPSIRKEETVKEKTPVEGVQNKIREETVLFQKCTEGPHVKKPEDIIQTKRVEELTKTKTSEEIIPGKSTEDLIETKKIFETVKVKTPVKTDEPLVEPTEKESEIKQTVSVESASVLPIETGAKPVREAIWRPFFREMRQEWKKFLSKHNDQWGKIIAQRNRCIGALLIMFIYCGLGGLLFRFTEGAFEAFYKCGVKRVKRDFVDSLWLGSHHLLEEEWKSQARKKLMELETQLHAAHEAGVTSYSGQRAWSFLNAVVYCLTVVTTIGYGHISPSTTTGRAITIVYAIFGIPMFLILLADFGKLFTRCIKFVWAFVRRVYYTGSCKKVRRTAPVQEVMKGVQLVYDFATFRRPSQMMNEVNEDAAKAPIAHPEDLELQVPLNPPSHPSPNIITNIPIDGHEPPGTPALSTFEVDDEFNLPISVAIVILVIYIFVGAIIYWTWETWGFFESFYFVFISMSTIGFGDFVPQHPMYMMASIVYLVFGLALTSMCINVVQEKLSDSFRQASAKIGATIGLRVNEDDGSITPVPPPQIELTEVHNTITKSHST